MRTTKPWRLGTRARLLLRGMRYAQILPYVSIDGWLSVGEAIALFELARSLPAERPRAVEIGSWQGKSTVCLARGLRGKHEPRLYCIDPFDGSGDPHSTGAYAERAGALAGPLRGAFERNLAAAGVRDLVEVRAGFSHDHAAALPGPLDLVFLDGDHGHEAVRRDFRDWAAKVRPGGYLAMHDVFHPVHEGPRAVVEEFVKPDPAWTDHRAIDSLFVARRAAT